ncbi:MAG: hypothetical protein ACE5GW_03140, partial [Planctomycetota bacterium]
MGPPPCRGRLPPPWTHAIRCFNSAAEIGRRHAPRLAPLHASDHPRGGGDRELFRARTERTDPKDPRALLELGSWCEERGHPGWAMICYRKVLQLAESPERPEASFRLARIEIGKERTERGYARLRAIATRYNHAGARALLEEAENELTRRQKEHLAHAGERLSKDDPKGALRAFTAAYELLPADPEGAPFVPAGEILRAIARCRDLLDDEHFNVKIRPVERSIRDCLRCKQYGGFERCIRCNGNGKVKKVIRVGRRRKVIWVTCGRCDGYKWLICKTCGGLETTTDKLSSKETEVLRRLIGKARGLKTLKKPLKSALQDVEGLILNLDDAPSLSYLRTVKAGYSVSRPLRSAIRTVPPSRDSLSIARKVWKNAVSDPRVRSNFLSSYACEFARHLAPFEML